jgi:lipopolysaccharide transport system permease protein
MIAAEERKASTAAPDEPGAPGERPVVEYGPESVLRRPGQLLRRMRADLKLAVGLGWRLFLRDLRAHYRQSILGYVWILIPPVVNTLLWVFLSAQGVVKVAVPGVAYPAYVLAGSVLWQMVADAITKPLQLAAQARPMLVKLAFPLEALPIASLLHVAFGSLIRFMLLAFALWWFGVSATDTLLFVPIGVFGLALLGTALGVLLLPAGLLYKDVEHAMPLVLQAAYYLTPIVYLAPKAWPASLVTDLNPVSPLLILTRGWLLTGQTESLQAALLVMAVTVPGLLIGWLMFRLALPFVIERMSG